MTSLILADLPGLGDAEVNCISVKDLHDAILIVWDLFAFLPFEEVFEKLRNIIFGGGAGIRNGI